MSLTKIEELPGHSIELGERGVKKHRRTLLGFSNNPYDQPESITNSRLCPKVGQQDPFDRAAFITAVSAERVLSDEPSNLWNVTYTSSTDYDDQQALSPLQLPARISWTSEQHERYVERDVKNRPILTTAKTLFPMKVDDSRWVISVEKNLAKVPNYLLTFTNVVNASSVTVDGVTFPKHTLMCKGLRIGDEIRETFRGQRITFRNVSFQLHYRRETWKGRAANVDESQLQDTSVAKRDRKTGDIVRDKKGEVVYVKALQRVPIQINGEVVTKPWPLDKAGHALPADYQPEDVRYIEADVYRAEQFLKLPLK